MGLSERQHYVPEFVLKQWLVDDCGQRHLFGHYWAPEAQKLMVKRKGLAAFCSGKGLWTLDRHPRGRDAIERIFFGRIENQAALAADVLMSGGPQDLSAEQRSEFTRFLHSLEFRRPSVIARLREFGGEGLPHGLDNDPEIAAAFATQGVNQRPSEWYDQNGGESSLRDQAIMILQGLIDNQERGQQIFDWCWSVVTLPDDVPEFCSSDRPLIRTEATDSPTVAWVLPLAPRKAFVATAREGVLRTIMSKSPKQLVVRVNAEQAVNCDRYVFTRSLDIERWLARRL